MGPGKGQMDKNGLIYLIYGAIKYSILIYCILITIISVSFTIYSNEIIIIIIIIIIDLSMLGNFYVAVVVC